MGAECRKCGYDFYDRCEHCEVVAERDLYREALERIVQTEIHVTGRDAANLRLIATRALKRK